jgi:hypothetical protein
MVLIASCVILLLEPPNNTILPAAIAATMKTPIPNDIFVAIVANAGIIGRYLFL